MQLRFLGESKNLKNVPADSARTAVSFHTTVDTRSPCFVPVLPVLPDHFYFALLSSRSILLEFFQQSQPSCLILVSLFPVPNSACFVGGVTPWAALRDHRFFWLQEGWPKDPWVQVPTTFSVQAWTSVSLLPSPLPPPLPSFSSFLPFSFCFLPPEY